MAVELLALVSALAFAGVGALVGARLLWLARHTRALPETLVGMSLFLLSAVSWPLMLWVTLVPDLAEALARGAWVAMSVAMAAGWSGVYGFTWQVFRPGAGWGRSLALLGIAVQLAAAVALSLRALTVPDVAALRHGSPASLLMLLGAETVYAWATCEAARYRALLARRVPLGLADPLVADRFGLWAWTCAFAFVSLVPSVLAMLRGAEANSVASQLTIGVFGLLCSLTLYFAFLPPAGYVRWVRGRAPLPVSHTGV